MRTNPQPGQIYRHRKHDPDNGKWHEYEVIGLVEAGTGYQDSPAYFTVGPCLNPYCEPLKCTLCTQKPYAHHKAWWKKWRKQKEPNP